jgi:hypothetical protein
MGVIAKRGLYFLLSYCVTATTWTLNRNFQQCTQQREEITTVVSVSSSALAPPPPHTTWIHVGGATHLLAVEGVGGANADEGTDTIVLCILAHRTSPLNN